MKKFGLPPVSYTVVVGTGSVKAYINCGKGVAGLVKAQAFAKSAIANGSVAKITFKL